MKAVSDLSDIEAIEAAMANSETAASTYELIRRSATANAAAPALSFFFSADEYTKAEHWTYSALLKNINRTANFFLSLGAKPDTVIAFALPNLPETHFVVWGGEAAGIVCAVNPLLEPAAIANILVAAKAEILVTLAPFPNTDLWPKIQALLPQLPLLRHLVLVDLANRIPVPRRTIAKAMRRLEVLRRYGLAGVRKAVPRQIQIHDFTRATTRQRADSLDGSRVISPGDISSFFCTGGTTGVPKIAMRRHGNEVANAVSTASLLGDGMAAGKTVLCGLPLFHVNATMVTGLVPFARGAHVVLASPQGYRGRNVVKNFWNIVQHYRVNFFSGVPTLYSALLDIPIEQRDIRSLEFGLCGAAPMPVEVFRTFQQRTGLRILEGYGMTEGACVSSVNPPCGDRRPGSVGLRIPGQAMKAVQIDAVGNYVRDCLDGESGLIVLSGPNIFAGYVQGEHNKGLWIDLGDGRRWLNTGDLGYRDADGYFWLTGRRKDLIIRGGHNIDPASIEEAFHGHPAVQLAAAVGRPDSYAGEVPVVYLQLKAGMQADEAELVAFGKHHISERAAQPKYLRLVPAVPLTAVGKIFKPELRRREIVDAIRQALSDHGIAANVTLQPDNARGEHMFIELSDPANEIRVRETLARFAFDYTIGSCACRTDRDDHATST